MSIDPVTPARVCGTCTLCCKIMGVAELDKPPDVWCRHCDKTRGCTIYVSRPTGCRRFDCLWLNSAGILDDSYRPDRCKVVMSVHEDGSTAYVNPDPGQAGIWRTPKIRMVVESLEESGMSVIIVERGVKLRSDGSPYIGEY